MNDSSEPKPAAPETVQEIPRRRRSWMLALGVICLVAGICLTAGIVLRDRRATEQGPRDLAQEARDDLDRRNFRPLSGSLDALLADPAYKPIPTQAHPLLGQPAPDFTPSDTADKPVNLTEKLKSGPVVLVFYYGYHCNHCVSQLFALNKDIEKFRELGATVVSVSADPSEQTRERFKQYGEFGFPVLSDPTNAVATKYGTFAPSKKPGEDGDLMHGTFVIDRSGRVVWANRGEAPFTENRTLLIELHRSRR
ncbi:MAG: hypothetical protein C0467_17995 [Planctomycetaceae bacterium]|nr:hypothetical protein [Planctomycetaceae bacterium]